MKLGRTVPELLATTTSKELSEWQAYERVSGPVDTSYGDEYLRQIAQLLHDIAFMFSQANFTDKSNRTGPVEKRERDYPRRRELMTEQDPEP